MGAKALTSGDLRDVLRISGIALEISQKDAQISEVLCQLEQTFKTGNNNFYFAKAHARALNLNAVIGRGIDSRFFHEFKAVYHKLDPFCRILSGKNLPTVVTRDHSRNQGRLGRYYDDFLKPQKIHHQMSIYLKTRHRFFGVLGLYRPPGTRGFSSRERTKAGLLAPYLVKALEKAQVTEQHQKQQRIMEFITNHVDYRGIIILDKDMNPVFENHHAKKIFAALSDTGTCRSTTWFVQKFILPIDGRLFRQPEPERHFFQYDNIKVYGYYQIIGRGSSTLILIYFSMGNSTGGRIRLIQDHGLSRRQAEVVHLLSQGLNNREIGEKLFISRYTVENHLKTIYARLRVRNRTELSYRLRECQIQNIQGKGA